MEWNIVVFEDEAEQINGLYGHICELFASMKSLFDCEDIARVVFSGQPDVAPPGEELAKVVGAPLTAADIEAIFHPKNPKRLRTEDLGRFDIIIVDLRFPHFLFDQPSDGDTGPYERGYRGLHVLRLARACDALSSTFVCSAYLRDISQDPKGKSFCQEMDEMIKSGGLTLFDKDFEDLCARLFSVMDLKRHRYSMDGNTRTRLHLIARRSRQDSMEPVLILGGSGTGKEQAAKHIHRVGQWLNRRCGLGRIVTVHCGALTAELASNELFGHVKGVYTGAETHVLGKILRSVGCGEITRKTDDKALQTLTANFGKDLLEWEKVFETTVGDANPNWPVAAAAVRGAGIETGRRILAFAKDFEKLENTIRNRMAKVLKLSPSEDYRDWLLDRSEDLLCFDEKRPLELRVTENAPLGTIFLDEFAELDIRVQAQLLRFLQDGEIQPLGYEGTISLRDASGDLHVRFIAATNDRTVRDQISALAVALANRGGEAQAQAGGIGKHGKRRKVKVRPDVLRRIEDWPVELGELQGYEICQESAHKGQPVIREGPLIIAEREERGFSAEIQWDTDALLTLRGLAEDPGLPGQRRQLRTIARRAMALAEELLHVGTGVLSDKRGWVTDEILAQAIAPISLPQTGKTDFQTATKAGFLEQVRQFVKEKGLWDCEKMTWEDLGKQDKLTRCKVMLYASQFLPDALSDVEDLATFFGTSGNTLNKSFIDQNSSDAKKTLRTAWTEITDSLAGEHKPKAGDEPRRWAFGSVMQDVRRRLRAGARPQPAEARGSR